MNGDVQQFDATVIGAGPAGALSAYLLARAGLSVALVERATLPRAKVCGGCLNARGMSVLVACGLGHVIDAACAAPLDEVIFSRGRRRVAIRASMGVAIDRAALDAGIAGAARAAGAVVLDGVAATVLHGVEDERRTVQLRHGNEAAGSIRARVVIAADGLGHPSLVELSEFRSNVAASSRVGFGVTGEGSSPLQSPEYATGTLHMAVSDCGYLGVTRLADGRFCIAAAVDREALRGGRPAGEWLCDTLASCGLPAIADLGDAAVKGTPLLTRRISRAASHRVFVVGDAAGYIEPITGEGMTWALVGATALAPIAEAGCRRWSPASEGAWDRAYRAAVVQRQTVNRLLAAGLRGRTSSRLLFAAAAACPAALRPVVRRLNQPLTCVRTQG